VVGRHVRDLRTGIREAGRAGLARSEHSQKALPTLLTITKRYIGLGRSHCLLWSHSADPLQVTKQRAGRTLATARCEPACSSLLVALAIAAPCCLLPLPVRLQLRFQRWSLADTNAHAGDQAC